MRETMIVNLRAEGKTINTMVVRCFDTEYEANKYCMDMNRVSQIISEIIKSE